MKTISNFTYFIGGENSDNTKIVFFEDNAPKNALKVSTADLIKTAINNVPETGLKPDDMFQRLQALNALHDQKTNEQLNFENDHFETIYNCVLNLRFNMLEASFNHFIEQIKTTK